MSAPSAPAAPAAPDEVVALASDLIRIDTTNTGDPDTTVGERKAAEYVAVQLDDAWVRSLSLYPLWHPGISPAD